ncbi:S8 family serine peptidase [Nocardioides speluncae]|uniref:S8 family serine peptidase n=1 Tax=Nocardioides speluncae TaxID=2670337 RepID=UPI00137B2EB7|nr:S8 family serine peptidase [Nocardioides speluncae]
MTALLLGAAAVISAPVATAGSPASSSATTAAAASDPQGGPARAEFDGYNGYSASGDVAKESNKTKPLDPTLGKPDGLPKPDVGDKLVPTIQDPAALALPTAPDATQVAAVRKALAADGSARVIVMTDATQRLEAKLSKAQVRAQRSAIADSLDGLQATLAGTGSVKHSELASVPSAVYDVSSAGLNKLLADSNVVSVVLDRQAESTLASSTAVIDSDLLNATGVLGNGFSGGPGGFQVAIMDSGVDGGHNAFTGRIVSQACSVTDNSCPGGTDFTTVAGSGEECTHSTDCDHGTHVGGIAAGSFFAGGHEGVARGAGIIALKVAQDNPTSPRWTAQFSAIDTALQHTLNLRNGPFPRLAAVNLSIGTNATFTVANQAACNAVDPTTVNLFGQLQAAGVAVVVAAGNNGSNNSMSFPGCATNAMAIGATSDADVPAGFTNSSAGLRWWAPGVNIDAAVPTTNNHGPKDGTSMATPHVTGSFALLRECVDGNGVPITNAAAAGRLDATGVNVTRNGVTRKRINVLDAATGTVNNNDFANAEVFGGNGPINDFDFTVCSDTEPGEPGPFSLDNGVWWRWTPATTGTATISTEDSGTFVTTFDTTLAVYTGNTIGSLVNIAADDDSGTGFRSSVTFPVNGGTTYAIKVDGFAASNGLLNLHIENGPPPTCQGVAATRVGTTGNDNITGTAGVDVIVAGAGNDTINGLGGNDRICGDAGNDLINGSTGDDIVFGGSGSDSIFGSDGNDILLGNPGGGSNDDVGDSISGGAGNDHLDGWVGNDNLRGGPGNDQLRGEAGTDSITYSDAPSGVTVNLVSNTATGGAGSDTIVLVENVIASPHNDNVRGNTGPNTVIAGAGNDTVDGGSGNDKLEGNLGNDFLRGRAGNDIINGLDGTDTVGYEFAPSAVVVNLGTSHVTGGEGNDTVLSIENARGSAHNDNIVGGASVNDLRGNGGNDTVRGVGGNDALRGGAGNDAIAGGTGNDNMLGEAGNDRLFGEAGNDRHNGGTGFDRCTGGAGTDSALSCEVTTGIP